MATYNLQVFGPNEQAKTLAFAEKHHAFGWFDFLKQRGVKCQVLECFYSSTEQSWTVLKSFGFSDGKGGEVVAD